MCVMWEGMYMYNVGGTKRCTSFLTEGCDTLGVIRKAFESDIVVCTCDPSTRQAEES